MPNKRLLLMIIVVLVTFALASSVLAMSSQHYAIDWMVISGGAGGSTASENFFADVTVGQTAIGQTSSAGYKVGLGYWYGAFRKWLVYLPVTLRDLVWH